MEGRSRIAVAVLLALTCLAVPSMGGPIPSKVEAHSVDLATVESFLEQEEVAPFSKLLASLLPTLQPTLHP